MQGRAFILKSGSPHRVELATLEGGTSKYQFRMFMDQLDTC